MDVIGELGPILQGSGLSFGGVLVTLIVMFARGYLWTKPQVESVRTNLKEELERSNTDRDYWRDAYADQKERSDSLAATLAQVVPLTGVTNKLLTAITEQAESGSAHEPG